MFTPQGSRVVRLYIRDRHPPVPIRPANECIVDFESDTNVTVAIVIVIDLATPVLVWAIPNKKVA